MKKKDFKSHDIYWYLPKRKTPFYYSTLYCKDSLHAMGKEYIKEYHKSPTVTHLKEYYAYQCEETELLSELEKRGFGNELYFKLFD